MSAPPTTYGDTERQECYHECEALRCERADQAHDERREEQPNACEQPEGCPQRARESCVRHGQSAPATGVSSPSARQLAESPATPVPSTVTSTALQPLPTMRRMSATAFMAIRSHDRNFLTCAYVASKYRWMAKLSIKKPSGVRYSGEPSIRTP